MNPNQRIEQIRQQLREAPQRLLTQLGATSAEGLPEADRATFDGLAAVFNTLADELPSAAPATPGADQPAPDVTRIGRVESLFNQTQTVVGAMAAALQSARAEADRFRADLESGALVTREQANDLARVAGEQATTQANTRFQQLNSRRATLATHGLQEPEEVAVMGLPDAEFEAAVTAARGRLNELNGLGLTYQNAPALTGEAVWSDRALARTKELLKVAPAGQPGTALFTRPPEANPPIVIA